MVIAQIDQTNLTQYIENLNIIYRNILQKLNSTQLAHQSLSGKIIGCTGDEPYQLKKIHEMIIEAGGIIGDKDIWQHDQVVIVGRSNYDIGYLQKSIYMGRRFNFICQYMSQEDFVTGYLNGNFVDYRNLDSRLHYHPGLMYIKSQKIGWPLADIYSSVTTKRVFWQILPPGEYTFDRIIDHYQHLRSLDNEIIIDKQRLELIYSLKPSELYIGSDEFKRYVVFYFDQACKAVLECPIFGNAIYVIDGGWKYLSQLTKAELMDYPDEVQRITHKGDWFSRLKKILDVEAWLK